ncbi:hypothetical protein PV326_003307, partial [Microctonus aethiopoides]
MCSSSEKFFHLGSYAIILCTEFKRQKHMEADSGNDATLKSVSLCQEIRQLQPYFKVLFLLQSRAHYDK